MRETTEVTIKRDIENVDWQAVADVYAETLGPEDPAQLERTWSRSYATVLAYADGRLVGAGRGDLGRRAGGANRWGGGAAGVPAPGHRLANDGGADGGAEGHGDPAHLRGGRERVVLREGGVPDAQAGDGAGVPGRVCGVRGVWFRARK